MAREDITSQFPTMGENGIPHSVVNMSGQRSPYTMVQPRDAGGPTNPDVPGTGSKRQRGQGFQIQEANGPRPNTIPMATRWPANAAASLETFRNVRLCPAAVGDRDFWARRAEGPRI